VVVVGVIEGRLSYSSGMYTRRFFIISLLIPLVFIIFGALVTIMITPKIPGHLGAVLVPYTSFFLFFVLWASRNTPQAIRYAAYRAPLVFLVFQITYLVLEFGLGVSLAKDIIGLGGVIIIISTYAILLGYLYIFLMEQGYLSYLFYMRHHHMAHKKSRSKITITPE